MFFGVRLSQVRKVVVAAPAVGTYIFGGLGIVLLIVLLLWIVRAFFKTKTAITESQQAKKRKKRKR